MSGDYEIPMTRVGEFLISPLLMPNAVLSQTLPPAKVIPLGCITKLDLPVDQILDAAKGRDLTGVVVMAFDETGETYFASSYADGGTVLWLMEKLKQRLLAVGT